VGINAWPGYEFIYLAAQKGYFKDAGLEVRVVEFSSLADARRAYERGQIDAIATTVVEVLQILDQSARKPRIVRVFDYSEGADVILARPGIPTGRELRGARIGVELASLGVYILARGLEQHGLQLSDVTMISGDQLSMEGQFDRGKLDAVVTYPPTSLKMLADSSAHAVFSTAEIPGEVLDVLAVDDALIQQRHEDVRRFLDAVERAMAYERQSPADAHAIMAEREGITAEEFAAALADGMTLVSASEQSEYLGPQGRLHEVVARTTAVLSQTQQLSPTTKPDPDVVYSGFVAAAGAR
jgi:NitT/TauT family transport system substrate-binding protein